VMLAITLLFLATTGLDSSSPNEPTSDIASALKDVCGDLGDLTHIESDAVKKGWETVELSGPNPLLLAIDSSRADTARLFRKWQLEFSPVITMKRLVSGRQLWLGITQYGVAAEERPKTITLECTIHDFEAPKVPTEKEISNGLAAELLRFKSDTKTYAFGAWQIDIASSETMFNLTYFSPALPKPAYASFVGLQLKATHFRRKK
jgi:hypothetical protein